MFGVLRNGKPLVPTGGSYGSSPLNISALNGRRVSSLKMGEHSRQCDPACWGPLGNMAILGGRSGSAVAVTRGGGRKGKSLAGDAQVRPRAAAVRFLSAARGEEGKHV